MPTFLVVFLLVLFRLSTAQTLDSCKQISVPPTNVTLFNIADISSKTAKEGQAVELLVDSEVRTADCLLIAKGASARGHVAKVGKPKIFGRSGKLEIAVDSVQTLQGTALGSTLASGVSGGDTLKEVLLIPGGAGILVAPVLLPLPGGHAKIPAGTPFEINLSGEVTLDGIPVEPVSANDAHLIIFRTPNDRGPSCSWSGIVCFGKGRYMDATLSPGRYKLPRFGALEIHAGQRVYLRQIDSEETPLVRTGGGIFEFFLPKMKMIEAARMQKLVKEDIKGPIVAR